MKRLIKALAAASLLASVPVAQAAEMPRANAPIDDASAMASGSIALWVALAAVAVAIFLIADSGSSPDSP